MPYREIWGILSDTHGLLRPEALRALGGVSQILHAGDVGKPALLDQLAGIAPVHAIRGNVDRPDCGLPEQLTVESPAGPALMIHNRADLYFSPRDRGLRIVIFGHTHKAEAYERDHVLWLNPGSAGPRRFRLPVTLALLRFRVADGGPEVEIRRLLAD